MDHVDAGVCTIVLRKDFLRALFVDSNLFGNPRAVRHARRTIEVQTFYEQKGTLENGR